MFEFYNIRETAYKTEFERGIGMPDSFEITLNGRKQQAAADKTVLNHLKENNVEPPNLCYHPSLGAIETCDTCIVKVNGEFVRSCSTELNPGDVVETFGE